MIKHIPTRPVEYKQQMINVYYLLQKENSTSIYFTTLNAYKLNLIYRRH